MFDPVIFVFRSRYGSTRLIRFPPILSLPLVSLYFCKYTASFT